MEDYLDREKYPKVVVMTQTREVDYIKLNSFLSIKNLLFEWPENLRFIINNQIKIKETEKIVIKHKDYIEFKTSFISLSKARNELLKLAKNYFGEYDYFIHIDDDAYIYDYNILIQSLLYLKRNNIKGLIIGSVCKPNLDPINKHIKNFKNFKELNIFNHNAIMGSCICYGTEVANNTNLFDERFGLGSRFGGSEETEIFFKVLDNKIKIIYNPCFIVIHPPTYKNQYGIKKMFNYGVGRGAVYKKHLHINRVIMYYFLFVSLISNLILLIFGFLSFNKSFGIRNTGLFIGKIYGFFLYKK